MTPVADTRLLERATSLWRLALRYAAHQGMMETDRSIDLLARTRHVGFRGARTLWATGEVDVDELERQAEYGAGAPRVFADGTRPVT